MTNLSIHVMRIKTLTILGKKSDWKPKHHETYGNSKENLQCCCFQFCLSYLLLQRIFAFCWAHQNLVIIKSYSVRNRLRTWLKEEKFYLINKKRRFLSLIQFFFLQLTALQARNVVKRKTSTPITISVASTFQNLNRKRARRLKENAVKGVVEREIRSQ